MNFLDEFQVMVSKYPDRAAVADYNGERITTYRIGCFESQDSGKAWRVGGYDRKSRHGLHGQADGICGGGNRDFDVWCSLCTSTAGISRGAP